MLMKLLINVFERARSKLTVTHSNNHVLSGLFSIFPTFYNNIFLFPIDSDIEITNFDSKTSSIIQDQPRSSFSKWLCTTPTSIDKPVF